MPSTTSSPDEGLNNETDEIGTNNEDTENDTENDTTGISSLTDDSSESNWGQFFSTLLVYLIYTICIGVVGSGFIYLTELSDQELENVFPTDEDFYRASGIVTPSVNVASCSDDPEKPNVIKRAVTSVLEDNFPYSMIKIKKEGEKIGFIDRMTNWFAGTVKASFIFNRILMKKWLRLFKDNGNSPFSNHAVQICFGMPLTCFLSLFALFSGFFSAFFGGFRYDFKVAIWGFFLIYTWSMSFLMSGVIFLRLAVTLLFFPMNQDWKQIARTISCNVKVLVIFFGFLATGAAYESLDSVIAGVMGIVYLMLVGFTVSQYFAKLFL